MLSIDGSTNTVAAPTAIMAEDKSTEFQT